MRIGLPHILASTLVLAAAVPVACGGGAVVTATTTSTAAGTGGHASSSTTGDQGGGIFVDGGNDPVVSATITPADGTIEVLNGAIPAFTQLTVHGVTMGGKTVDGVDGGEWSYDRPDVATLDAST